MKEESIIDQLKKPVKSFLLEKEGVERNREKIVYLDKKVEFENDTILYERNKIGEYDEKNRKIIIYDDCYNALENRKLFNPITGHPASLTNCEISVISGRNTHVFKTDHLGRIVSRRSIIREKYVSRVPDQQTRAKRHKGEDGFTDTHKYYKDQGGHGQAKSASGLGEMINLFAQAFKVNNSTEWKSQEAYQGKLVKKDEIDFESGNDFIFEGDNVRPSQVRVIIKNNLNGDSYDRTFNNSNDIASPIIDNDKPYRNSFEKVEVEPSVVLPINDSGQSIRNLKKGKVEKKVEEPQKKKRKLILVLLLLLLFISFFIFNPFSFKNTETKINLSNENVESVSIENTKAPILVEKEDLSLMFSKPLDTLTRSLINNSEILNTIKTDRIMPVIGIMFDYNSSNLSEIGKQVLDLFVDNYKSIKVDNYLIIEGFSCTVGSQEYNLILTNERANIIKDYLISLGMDATKLNVKPVGKGSYVNEKGEGEDLILNRRSNITIYPA